MVDDEEVIRQQICGFIKKQRPGFSVSEFATGEELLAAETEYDIIFLDIQMEGMGGIEAARHLRQRGGDAVLVFITGIKDHVFKAFDVSAFHYLLKPVEEQRFTEVLGRAAEEAGKRKERKGRQIFIRTKNQGYTLNLDSILHVESRGKKVEVHTADTEEIIEAYATMEEMEGQIHILLQRFLTENLILSINLTENRENRNRARDNDRIDMMDDASVYMEIIKDNIEYEHHMKYGDWSEKGLYEEIYEVICEIVCVKRKTVKVNGEDYPYELVKSKFLKLNSSHLEYVIGCMKETTTKIANIRAYMVTALYNAPNTMNHYYQQLVQHDMYGGGWQEKGLFHFEPE